MNPSYMEPTVMHMHVVSVSCVHNSRVKERHNTVIASFLHCVSQGEERERGRGRERGWGGGGRRKEGEGEREGEREGWGRGRGREGERERETKLNLYHNTLSYNIYITGCLTIA